MTERLHPTRRLLVGPAFWVASGLNLALAVGLCFVPLFDLLGYEFSAALALVAATAAGPLAIGVVRRDPDRPALGLWVRACLAAWVSLALPLLVIGLNALRVPNCNFGQGLVFFGLLPMAGVLVTTGWGVALGLLVKRRFLAGLAFAGLWLAVAAANLWQVYRGPQVDSYNQLIGWVAGPIYDDVVEPGWPLIFSRLTGLVWAATWVCAAAALAKRPTRHRRGPAWLGLAVFGLVAWGLTAWADDLGFGRSGQAVEQALSGVTTTDRFVIHHAPDLKPEQVRRLARDHEFRLYQIEQLLGPQQLPPIHSWVFPSAQAKRRLAGAGRTQYAKPWITSMYLNSAVFPHPTLKHELVHVVAGAFGAEPFGVSARNLVMINPGLTEGIAVAVDWPAGRFDRHTWSAALRAIGKAPPIEQLFSPVGFWTAAAGRSYTLAGSFVRYLLTTYGPGPLIAAYRAGDLTGHYPKPTPDLIADWQAFLDARELDPATVELARLRFERGSVFERVCAHEVAALRVQAARQLGAGDLAAAEATLDELLGHLPHDLSAAEARIEIRLRQERPEQAAEMAEQLLARTDLGAATKARLAGRMGDLMWRLDKPDRAAALWQELIDAHLSDGSDRTALVKLQALARGPAGRRVLAFLEQGRVTALSLLDLHTAASQAPGWGAVWYLLGRQLFNKDLCDRALPHLWRAAQAGLEHPALAAENLRLIAVCHHRLGTRPAGADDADLAVAPTDRPRAMGTAAAVLAVMAQFPRHEGELIEVHDWLERIHFDRTRPVSISSSSPADPDRP